MCVCDECVILCIHPLYDRRSCSTCFTSSCTHLIKQKHAWVNFLEQGHLFPDFPLSHTFLSILATAHAQAHKFVCPPLWHCLHDAPNHAQVCIKKETKMRRVYTECTAHIQCGKKLLDSYQMQVVQLKKIREVCNFRHMYHSTVKDRM